MQTYTEGERGGGGRKRKRERERIVVGWDDLKRSTSPPSPHSVTGILPNVTPTLISSFHECIFDPFILKYVIQI